MSIPVRYVQYSFGLHRIFYIPDGGGDLPSPPTVLYYRPNKDDKMIIPLKHLDTGVYYFEIDFKVQGNHLFIYREESQRTGILNALVSPY